MALSDPASVASVRYSISALLCFSAAITIICLIITAARLDYYSSLYNPSKLVGLVAASMTLIIHAIRYANHSW
ncbi:hypothetical protein BOTBODRAFT_363167 [Botryobasidium botryosum FD-172 SS1]|uniref:Uncharacterized protein n=1 Tax=Botryobasidium botryosum (strain FD-172 SS1) TaxID=930990 RepID=A0A067MPS0_BOTB1|nr:hypothetical protein BOTBODRAFT_363167 [Botryobasidium botryosum FD-172 SS1]